MNEIPILKKEVMQEWEKFRNRVLPPAERQKEWAQTPAEWGNLPEKERRHLSELNAFVQKILDSSEECIPEIYDEHPTDLKLLVIFRLNRVGSFLENYLQDNSAINVPAVDDPIYSFFRDLMLHS